MTLRVLGILTLFAFSLLKGHASMQWIKFFLFLPTLSHKKRIKDGYTPLFAACYNGYQQWRFFLTGNPDHLEVAKFILSSKANVDQCNRVLFVAKKKEKFLMTERGFSYFYCCSTREFGCSSMVDFYWMWCSSSENGKSTLCCQKFRSTTGWHDPASQSCRPELCRGN